MHYANGRPAKIGDIVRGKGYNVKHEIIGMLVGAQPQNTACNCTIACVTTNSTVVSKGWRVNTPSGTSLVGDLVFPSGEVEGIVRTLPSAVEATFEYGQLDAFVAIDPSTGEVLPQSDAQIEPTDIQMGTGSDAKKETVEEILDTPKA